MRTLTLIGAAAAALLLPVVQAQAGGLNFSTSGSASANVTFQTCGCKKSSFSDYKTAASDSYLNRSRHSIQIGTASSSSVDITGHHTGFMGSNSADAASSISNGGY